MVIESSYKFSSAIKFPNLSTLAKTISTAVMRTDQATLRPAEDPLSEDGFLEIQRHLASNNNSNSRFYLRMDSVEVEGEDNNEDGTAIPQQIQIPTYVWQDKPIFGWRKEVTVRVDGLSAGGIDVSYVPPPSTTNNSNNNHNNQQPTNIRNEAELKIAAVTHNLPQQVQGLFAYSARTTCFCQGCIINKVKLGRRSKLIQCVYGKAGCNGWLHKECIEMCVGTAPKGHSLWTKAICPLCVKYLMGTGELAHYYEDGTM
jgi:hypothetical protein